MSEATTFWLTLCVFVSTYAGLVLGKLPGLRTDRTGIALIGATLVLSLGLLSFGDAVKAIDFGTIALLLGMMMVVVYLRRAGFFDVLAQKVLDGCREPRLLLGVVMLLSGVLSALLVNDVVCLALTPLVIRLTRHCRLDPRPHLIGLAVASNIGSTATLTGNPQNMIIGGLSQIGYVRFAAKLAPVAVLGLAVAYAIALVVFRRALRAGSAGLAPDDDAGPRPLRPRQRRLLVKSLLVTAATVILFFAGAPMPIVALGAASVLLLDRVNPDGVYRLVHWSLLLMFAGLFVVVHAFEVHVLAKLDMAGWVAGQNEPIALLSGVSAVLSNIVSNVPAVLLFKPIIPHMEATFQETAWLALAMSSTLAGNLTILGSVANLIVVENARREGVTISLSDYCRLGVPVTLVTIVIGVVWLGFTGTD
ncbi:MAG: anion transporter [Gemmataceae bacterium]